MDYTDENLVPVGTTNDEVHETLIKGALDDAGIRYVVQSFHDEAFDGLFEETYGHSRILVFEDDAEKAEEIISQVSIPSDGKTASPDGEAADESSSL
ncbi:MAG TPA: DUF2007 domain-containing protein [bacterium]|nr:DUF2007 domain-containing protein [Candidatus Omnitrophota bacterium]HOL92931.1 DUF2007 domain-containing protein [bacterium]HPP00251.1 DUF2007 domain-containing protein [bacterium]HXK95212.1 DUF2007 domain-containing protein [bacterium]